jgi:thioredoxin reductase (NADPH)
MPRPVIMVIDDEPGELAALLEALTRRFGADYRVVPHLSGDRALEDLGRIPSEGGEVALLIADQWMPGMTGRELLSRAHELSRAAKRVLLVGWGDHTGSSNVLEGCAVGELDNYLVKPWAPAEVHLYPLVSEFLAEWTRVYGSGGKLVQLIGERPSRRTQEMEELLQRSGILYAFHEAATPEGRVLLEQVKQATPPGARGVTRVPLPVVILLDGRALAAPSNAELADALGASDLDEASCDLIVIGAGPAGLAAAVYAASEWLRTVVVEREAVGGQAGTSSLIRNDLGFPRGIGGAELAQRAYQQAWLFGAKYVIGREVRELRSSAGRHVLVLSDGRELSCRAVLIASGARYRLLDVPGIERLVGMGIYYVSMGEDTRPIRGQDVYVVGGGNSAGQAAMHLAKNARQVTLIVRGTSLAQSMSDYLIHQITHQSNVEVRLRTEVVGVDGARALERITLRDDASGKEEAVPAKMLFVLIGARPHTEWLGDAVLRDARGFILTGHDLPPSAVAKGPDPMPFETSVRGVFAIGDVRSGSLKRVASAVGEGTVAMRFVQEYLGRAAGSGG